nr:MAG TPA: hypothetical protein [Caudoviricetes sp.]
MSYYKTLCLTGGNPTIFRNNEQCPSQTNRKVDRANRRNQGNHRILAR